MNTTNLQASFPATYQKFYSNNDIVMNGSFSIAWSPFAMGHRSNYLRLKTKTNLKCFAGLNKTQDRKVTFKTIDFYNIVEDRFDEYNFADVNQKSAQIVEFIEGFLADNGAKFGLDISILSEVPRGHSFGFSGTFGPTLAMAIFMALWKIDQNVFDNYDDFLASDMAREVFLFAWKFEYISKYGNTTGENSINTLYNYPHPTLFFCEKFDFDTKLEDLDKIKYKFYDITHKFSKNIVTTEIPLDFCVIYSGLPSETHKVEQFLKSDIKKFNKLEEFLDKEVIEETEDLDLYFKKFTKKDYIYQNLMDNIVVLSINVLKTFKQIFEDGYDTRHVDKLIDNINHYRYAISFVEKQTTFAKSLIYFFKKNKNAFNEKIGIMPIFSGKIWGGYLLVMEQFKNRKNLEKTLDDLREHYPDLAVEYSSWEDGSCSDGIKLEQYVSEKVYSKYLDPSKLILEFNTGQNIVGEYSELLEKWKEAIIIDQVSKKIYMKGKKFTSKDMPSQSATVEILSVLMANLGKEVTNDMLEVSSYSKNRNNILGKIIMPLNALAKEHYGKELELSCKGGLSEFHVFLQEKDILMGVIRKI